MLPEVKNDLKYFLSILQSIGKIAYYTKNIESAESLIEEQEQLIYNACLTLFTNIGESIGKLSEESKAKLNSKSLRGAIGVRNRIAHDYSNVNAFVIYEIITNDLPALKEDVSFLIKKYITESKIDKAEFWAAKKSTYYKFIDFTTL
jgi:uncharacterized protein with HEPN domain